MNTGQSNVCNNTHSISHSIKLYSDKSSRSKTGSNLSPTTLARFIEAVKNAPSIHPKKAALIKKQVRNGEYLSGDTLDKMAEVLVQKFKRGST